MHGKRMTVFVGEADQWNHGPLYLAILEKLRSEGCAGATVTRGIAGFGAQAHLKTARLLDLSLDLPIVITLIDRPERIERLATEVAAMLAAGVITVEDTEVHFYSPAFAGGLPDAAVGDLMCTAPEAVTPDIPVVEVVERLLARNYNELPVIDAERRVIGVIGDRDLLERDLIPGVLPLHRGAGPEAVADLLQRVKTSGAKVAQAMTTPPVTISAAARVREAAQLMHERRLKRLPVVDDAGRLVGVLGRFDILSSIATGWARRTVPHGIHLPQEHRTTAEIMERDVPALPGTTPLAEVVGALVSSESEGVVVVDAERHPIGIVTGADLLGRVSPAERPGLLTWLRSRWSADAERQLRRSHGQRAADVMTSPVVTVRDSAPVIDALTLTTARHLKQVPVVDEAGRLVGVVARPALLAASLDVAGA
jgi:CBS domain-containing protein